MRFVNKFRFFSGILLMLFLFGSYFVEIMVDSGVNYVTTDTLLGLVIFHNIFVLSFYILIACLLVLTGIKRIRFL
ncbi:MAG: hypothetical protein AABX96_02270 [Nanoarchaeota archaeon]